MSFSKEYSEWHLTPKGWIKGTTKGDGNGLGVILLYFCCNLGWFYKGQRTIILYPAMFQALSYNA